MPSYLAAIYIYIYIYLAAIYIYLLCITLPVPGICPLATRHIALTMTCHAMEGDVMSWPSYSPDDIPVLHMSVLNPVPHNPCHRPLSGA